MKIFKTILIVTGIIITIIAVAIFFFMQTKVFGKNPEGERLERIKRSANYKDGAFQNLSPTEITLKEASFFGMIKDQINKPKLATPQHPLPSIKTDLKNLGANKPTIIWFGHSSYFIKSRETKILIDPVFSGNVSPVSFFGKAFKGTDIYAAEDFPELDAIFITHDHYDHLDYETISKLISKTKMFYVPLGVGAHLEHWGVEPQKIVELDWWGEVGIADQIKLIATPARHFSGRSFKRNRTLWTSYVLRLHGYNIVIGGDSGYDSHFKEIGKRLGPFDIAILEAGQYGKNWPYIHMFPEETVRAAKELNAKVLFPVHWGKFTLSFHEWNEPIEKVASIAKSESLKITTPIIGEAIVLDEKYPQKNWWKDLN